MPAHLCTSANTTSASCRESRPSWALIGTRCGNQLQVALGQGLVRECALVSDSMSVAVSVELVVVLLLVAVVDVDGGILETSVGVDGGTLVAVVEVDGGTLVAVVRVDPGTLVAIMAVDGALVTSAAQLLFVGPACEPAEWNCFC